MKAINTLNLANKKCNTYRLINGEYVLHLQDIPLRYESLSPISTGQRVDDNAIERTLLCTYFAMLDNIDLMYGDRIEVRSDNRMFVVVGYDDFDEREVSHKEVLMRLLNSQVHEQIVIKRINDTQTNYDPVLKEWVDEKSFTSTVTSALIDRIRPGGFSEKATAGLIEGFEAKITMELPDRVTVRDTVVIYGEEHHVVRVENLPYQSFVYVQKKLPEGVQFT